MSLPESSSSLSPMSRPRISRCPVALTPVATTTAIDTNWESLVHEGLQGLRRGGVGDGERQKEAPEADQVTAQTQP